MNHVNTIRNLKSKKPEYALWKEFLRVQKRDLVLKKINPQYCSNHNTIKIDVAPKSI